MLKVNFKEKYVRLSDLVPGQAAVSKDRESFFVCSHHYCKVNKANVPAITQLNNLTDQYADKRDMSQLVRVLESGDSFSCTQG